MDLAAKGRLNERRVADDLRTFFGKEVIDKAEPEYGVVRNAYHNKSVEIEENLEALKPRLEKFNRERYRQEKELKNAQADLNKEFAYESSDLERERGIQAAKRAFDVMRKFSNEVISLFIFEYFPYNFAGNISRLM